MQVGDEGFHLRLAPHAGFGSGDLLFVSGQIPLDPATGEVLRSQAFGGPGKQEIWWLAVDGDRVAMALSVNGEVDFGGGRIVVQQVGEDVDDAAVVLLDGALDHVWSRSWGGDGDDDAFAAALGAGSLFVGGEFTGTIDVGTGPMLSNVTDAYLLRIDD